MNNFSVDRQRTSLPLTPTPAGRGAAPPASVEPLSAPPSAPEPALGGGDQIELNMGTNPAPEEFDPSAVLDEPKVVPPELDERVDAALEQNEKVFANTARQISLEVRNPNGLLSQEHKNKARTLGVQSEALKAREGKVQELLTEMEGAGLNETQEFKDLQSDLQLLQKSRQVVDATKAVHDALGQLSDVNKPTPSTAVQNLLPLQQQLSQAVSELNQTAYQVGNIPEAVEQIINNGENAAAHVGDIAELAQNPVVLSTRQAYGAPTNVNGMLVQYEAYVKLAENGEAHRKRENHPHKGVGYIDRPGMTPDAAGFVEYAKAGVQDSEAFAKRFEKTSQEIERFFAQPNLTPEQIAAKKQQVMDQIATSFQNTSGEYVVKADRVATVQKIYGDQFNVAHSEYLAKNNQVAVDRLGEMSAEVDKFFAQPGLTPDAIARQRTEVSQRISEVTRAFESLGFNDDLQESMNSKFLREFDQKASMYLSGQQSAVDFNSNEQNVGQVIQNNQQADRLNDGIGLEQVSGFGRTADGVLQSDNRENISRAEAVQQQIDNNLQNVSELQTQQSESVDHQLSNLEEFLDAAAPGTHAKIYVGAGIKFGIGKEGVASAEVSAGVGLSVTAEKASGQGAGYLLHADFDLEATAKAEFLGLFEAELGYEYHKTLAGIGFRTATEVETYVGHFQSLIDAYKNDDEAGFKAATRQIDEMSKRYSYDASSHVGKGSMSVDIAGVKTKREMAISSESADYFIPPELRTSNADREYVKGTTAKFSYSIGDFSLTLTSSKSASYSDPAHTQPLAVKGSPDQDPKDAQQSSNITSVTVGVSGSVLKGLVAPGGEGLGVLPEAVVASMIANLREQDPALQQVDDKTLSDQIGAMLTHASADAVLAARLAQLDQALGTSSDDDNGVKSNAYLRVGSADGNLFIDIGFSAEAKFKASSPGTGWGGYIKGGVEVEYARRFQ